MYCRHIRNTYCKTIRSFSFAGSLRVAMNRAIWKERTGQCLVCGLQNRNFSKEPL